MDDGGESYWNTSETKAQAFNFDEDVLDILTYDLLVEPGHKAQQLLKTGEADSIFGGTTSKRPLLPLSSLISSEDLELVLLAQSGKDPPSREKQKSPISDTVANTLTRLVLGRSCSLHVHKSWQSKTELLDGAILLGDGNVLMAIVLFLVQTLKKKLVYELLAARPTALNHYLSYLLTEGKASELTDFLTMMARSPEAAIKSYQIIMKCSGNNVDVLLKKLKNLLANQFSLPVIDPHQTKLVNGYIKLLEWQYCMAKSTLYNLSPLQCLAYCCANHWSEGAGKILSPLTLCQIQQISPIQFDWTALNVHATLQNWDIVETLFTKKDWLGRTTLSSNVPTEAIVLRLRQLGADSNVLASHIRCVGSSDQRLELAKKFKVHSLVVEELSRQRDRVALTNYRLTLNPQTEHYFLLENVLRDPTIKWKN